MTMFQFCFISQIDNSSLHMFVSYLKWILQKYLKRKVNMGQAMENMLNRAKLQFLLKLRVIPSEVR